MPAYVWKVSPIELSLLAFLFALPSLISGPFIGAALDRGRAEKIMMWSAFGSALLSICMVAANTFLCFSLFVLFKGVANTVYWPASTLVTQSIVAPAARVGYFSLLSASDQTTKIATPLIAGALALALPMSWVFLISALAMLLVSLCIFKLDLAIQRGQPTPRAISGFLNALVEGWNLLRGVPRMLKISMGLGVGVSFALAIYDPHLPSFLHAFHFDVGTYSVLLSATGAGALSGALILHFFFSRSRAITVIYAGLVAFSLAIITAAAMVTIHPERVSSFLLIGLWFLNGLGYEVFSVGCSVTIQNLCPPAILGRIHASIRSVRMLAIMSGPALGAILISNFSYSAPFLVAGGVCLVLLFVAAHQLDK